MNSLSILSSRVDEFIGTTPPQTPSSEAFRELRSQQLDEKLSRLDNTQLPPPALSSFGGSQSSSSKEGHNGGLNHSTIKTTATANKSEEKEKEIMGKPELSALGKMYTGVSECCSGAYHWLVSALALCVGWIASWFYDETGQFSLTMPFRTVFTALLRMLRIRTDQEPSTPATRPSHMIKRRTNSHTSSPKSTEDVDAEYTTGTSTALAVQSGAPHSRSKSTNVEGSSDEITPRRSIRIRLYNEASASKPSKAAQLKSPTSPATSLRLTKYPRAPGPPRPLLSKNTSQKTLILDLDETLIHSLAKGGRMTSGHMVEVKLDRQHAILYYVHKRPYCDEFLRKVHKWYNLVVFTASVQEYADPVIDWLEQEKKYFKGRYYRQHCTNRNGAYIKDISAIEPDLSKVIIIDNSPLSYTFHEDNAIPIEGWINDPTDIDLLNLIPLLHALHYVTDVRALLALRMGESFTS